MDCLKTLSNVNIVSLMAIFFFSVVIAAGVYAHVLSRVTCTIRPMGLDEKQKLRVLFVVGLFPVLNWGIPIFLLLKFLVGGIASIVRTFRMVLRRLYGKPNRFERRK